MCILEKLKKKIKKSDKRPGLQIQNPDHLRIPGSGSETLSQRGRDII